MFLPGSTYRRSLAVLLVLVFMLPPSTCFTAAGPEEKVTIHFFWAPNCNHCAEARPKLEKIASAFPGAGLRSHDIWNDREDFHRLVDLSRSTGLPFGTPTVVVGDRVWVGFSDITADEIERAVETCLRDPCPNLLMEPASKQKPFSAVAPPGKADPPQSLVLPGLGEVEPSRLSLPVLAAVLGLLDSVNPCAFFVLLFLLSLLVHARSRRFMLLVGVTFVLCSGIVYFLFMAAWLNLFLFVGHLPIISVAAGVAALVIGGMNIKDFFRFHEGPTLSIPERAKPRLFSRMRGLLQQAGPLPVLAGTVGLALTANAYELLCTAGFPMVFTRTLTFHGLDTGAYYGYLLLYNVFYVLPLVGIVLCFAWTLGSRKLSEGEGRILKLLSGMMMFLLGLVLLFRPTLLNSPLSAVGLLLAALVLTTLTVVVCSKRRSTERGK